MISRTLAVLCLLLSIAPAQEFRGTISGTISDAQDSLIPNVRVVAIELSTRTESQTISDTSGKYVIPFLAPGTYQMTAEARGFKRYQRDRFALEAGDRPVLDIRLEVGEIQQTVTVGGEVPLLETGTGSVGQVLTSQQVEDFPLNGRTPLMLAQLAMGVVGVPTGTGTAGGATPWDTAGPTQLSIGGSAHASSELLIDGAPDNSWNMNVGYNPPQDAVREVRVQSFEADASFGHTGGGTVNQITRSGTNDLHGSAYEFNKVSALAATNFFVNKNGQTKPHSVYNQYGLTAGGPIWLPKIVNWRNKVFWFFAWEGVQNPAPQNTITTVPTAAERNGDFSALLKAGANYQIYDPLTGSLSGTQIARQPFANNVIPANRINSIAQAYLKYYPAPNNPGLKDGLDNFVTSPVGPLGFANEFGRFDFNVSQKHKLFWDMRRTALDPDRAQDYFGNAATGLSLNRRNWGVTLDDVYTFTPTLVSDIRLNWTRFREVYTVNSSGFDPTSLGFPSYMASNSTYLQMPAILFSGTTFNPLNTRASIVYDNPGDSFQIFGILVKFWRSHTFKFGTDVREYRMADFKPNYSTGQFTFSPTWTTGPFSNTGAAPLGQEFASFLLGYPASGEYDVNTSNIAESRYYSVFFQDDWRARSDLSINLGIRFEHETPTTERFDRSVNGYDYSTASPIAAQAMAAYAKNPIPQIPVSQFNVRGGLTFANSQNPDIYQTPSNIFSPRFGFAWTPKFLDGKTVFRGGTAVFAYPIGIDGNQLLNQEGFSQITQYQATSNNFLSPANTLSNPFPNGILQPPGSSLGLSTFLGQSVTFFNPERRNSYSVRWNFGVQHQLPGNTIVEVAYIGNHSVHLPIASLDLNAVPQAYLSKSAARDQATINLLSSSVPNPFAGLLPGAGSLNGSTVPLQQLVVPFPQFPVDGVIMQQSTGGSSYYESLNARLEKRFSNGLSFITNFVWSSLIERITYLNANDPAPEKRISADSRPLRVVTAVTYELPVGKGKLLDLGSRWKDTILGGWVVTAIYTWEQGPPLSWGNVIYNGGDIHLNPRQVNGPAFDVTRFNTVSTQQLASNVRTFDTMFNNLRADGINALNASLAKKFYFTERINLALRLEAFNAPNRPAFDVPNLTPTSTSFGLITAQTINPRQIQLGARLVW